MDSSKTVMAHVNHLTNMVNIMEEVGHFIPESNKKRVLLRGVRDEYAVTASVIRATGKTFSLAIA